ncbi:MAG: GRRM system radical SAM/SPASM domain protein [Thiotrichales bacterium]|nr:GRRM system radical SAM/SPASM domain protein [Thiotrichales bacterium]
MTTGPVQLLVIQPTPFCNLDCSYCYLPNRNSTARMDWTTLELAVKRVLESRFLGRVLSIVWHAGEPLVLPVDWYEEAFDRIESLNSGRTSITHHVQTNGVLINERWIELFHSRGVQVGISLDGPERLHNAHRKTRTGTGTHHRVMSAIELLNTSKLDYHVICVLTSAAMEAADEVYDFFSDCGVRMVGFNIEEIEGSNTSSSLSRPGMVEAYRRFLARILELAKADGSLRIREFETARNLILSRGWEPMNNQQATPLQIVSVGVDGNMSTFSPELMGTRNPTYGDFIFGNVKNHRLEELLTDDSFTAVHEEIQSGIVACRNRCTYFMTCGGGAPANKVFETGRFDVTETMFCRLACQAPIDVVLDDLETELGLNN